MKRNLQICKTCQYNVPMNIHVGAGPDVDNSIEEWKKEFGDMMCALRYEELLYSFIVKEKIKSLAEDVPHQTKCVRSMDRIVLEQYGPANGYRY